jgi:hypothetical protein
MYARTAVRLIPGPIDAAAVDRLRAAAAAAPQSRIVVQLPGRARAAARLARDFGAARSGPAAELDAAPAPVWAAAAQLRLATSYSLPNGRRYALLEPLP